MSSVANITLVIAVLLLLISIVQPIAARVRLPYTVLLAVVGVAVGGLSSFLLYTPLTDAFDDIVRPLVELPVSASLFLIVFLPLLLFNAALTIDLREIIQDAAPILTLAILAVVAAAAAIGVTLSLAGVPLVMALLLGTIVATTDPAAVVAIFREVGAPLRLTRLIEGEALLNDAAAIVLFAILIEMATGDTHPNVAAGILRFIEAFVGGIVLGAVGGRLFGAVLPWLGGSRTAEVTLSVALPYLVYLVGEDVFDVSGVVAVASAGLTGGALARARLRPASWRYMERLWEQIDFFASSLIFLIASTLVPRLLGSLHWHDLLLLPLAIAAALVSRAAVLFGVLPLLSAARLSQRISAAYKLAITWGGLRGAITLALALSVTENKHIDADGKEFIAVLATGFVLFTLLVNGLTLHPVIRLLGLNRLSALNQAIRDKVLALSLADIRDVVRRTAHACSVEPAAAHDAALPYRNLIADLASRPDLQEMISDQDRIRIGLVAVTNRERRIILDHHEQNTISGVTVERLLRNSNMILDAARADGRAGYERSAATLTAFSQPFRIAHFLHRTFSLDAALRREISIRFEILLTRRLTLEDLAVFTTRRLRPLLGTDTAKTISDILADRMTATVGALDALRLQYPEYARSLDQRFLQQTGLHLLSSRFRDLYEDGLIGGELLHDLEREHATTLMLAAKRTPLDLGLQTEKLIASVELFADLSPAELKALVRLFRSRLLVPGEVVIRKGDRGRDMYFISSGAVEVVLPDGRVRLGSGEFFGEMALLTRQPRRADVVSLGYGRVLQLSGADFDRVLKRYPRAREEIERAAEERTTRPKVPQA